MGVNFELRVKTRLFLGALFLFLAVFLISSSLSFSKEFDSQGSRARRLLAVGRSCPGCVSFPRNVPNFRTRFRHQQQRTPHHPRHRDHNGAAEDQLVGRKMLEYQATTPATTTIDGDKVASNRSGSAVEPQVRGVHHTDRYVPGGPDPLHHRSTPPSMLVPDLN